MRTSAIVCTALAGTLGFGSLASAQEWQGRRDRDQRSEQRSERRHDGRQDGWRDGRHDGRHDGRREGWRESRRDDRHDGRRDGRHDGRHDGWRQTWQQPQYQQPRYHGYSQPRHYGHAPRFHRGGYLPHEYRTRTYYVNDWHAHHGLYAPPYGHQWVNVGGEFLLVALATGLIANLLVQ